MNDEMKLEYIAVVMVQMREKGVPYFRLKLLLARFNVQNVEQLASTAYSIFLKCLHDMCREYRII